MKTVAQWAEQLPELIRIEFLKEAEKQKTDIDAVLDINYSGFSQSLFFHIAEIDKWFWYGLRDNEYVDPTSADYIDESVPYTKSEVDAMILEYADPNDEVCKVMLWNLAKPKEDEQDKVELENENIEFKKRHKSLLLRLNAKTKAFNKICDENFNLKKQVNYWIEVCQEKNKEITELKITPSPDTVYINRLRSEIIESKKENEALKSTIAGLNAIVETQKVEIAELENNNHELLEQIKPTPQPKTSLLQRFNNWIS